MKFRLIISALLLSIALQAQSYDSATIDALENKAISCILTGDNRQARTVYLKMADIYRKNGDYEKEVGSLCAVVGYTESIADKMLIIKEIEDKIAAVKKPNNPLLLKAYLVLAKTEVYLLEGNQKQATEELLEVLNESRNLDLAEEDQKFVLVNILQSLGSIATQKGSRKEAISYFDRADTVIGEVTKPLESLYKAINEMNLGAAYSALNNFSMTEDYYQKSISLFKSCGGKKSWYYSFLLSNLSSLYGKNALYSDSLDYGYQALSVIPKNFPSRIPVLIGCATACSSMGKFSDAEKLLNEAELLMGKYGAQEEWRSLFERAQMGLYRQTGRLKASIEVGEKALKRMKQQSTGNPEEMYRLYRSLSYNASLVGDVNSAISYLTDAMTMYVEVYGKSGDEYYAMIYESGQLLKDIGEKDMGETAQEYVKNYFKAKYGAESRYVKRLMDGSGGGVLNDIDLLVEASFSDISASRFDDALLKINEAIKQSRVSGFIGSNLLSLLAFRLDIIELKQDTKALKIAAEEYNEELRRDMMVNLSYMTERERESYYASILPSVDYAHLSEFDPTLSTSIYDALLLRKNFLLGAGLSLEKLIADSGDPTLQRLLSEMKYLRCGKAQNMNLSAKERFNAKHRSDSLENVLLKASHNYGDYLSLAKMRWQDVRNSLATNEIAVEFYVAGTKTLPVYCMLVLRNDWDAPRNFILFKDDDNLIEKGLNPQYIERVYTDSGYYEAFWAPLDEYVKKGDRIYFSLDGFLTAYAFEHFVSKTGERAMDRFELHRVSSTRELIGRKSTTPAQSAALFGGFDYNLSGEEVSYYATATRSKQPYTEWGYLPGSLAEVENASRIIKDKMSVMMYTGEQGLESSFKALSGVAPDLLHIATHGYYINGDGDPMDRAGLVFSGANSLSGDDVAESGEDGLLKASEIAFLDLRNTELIVLSACESGVGRISSDGVYGLQRAFKKAGVHSIMMSLWKVDDQVTAEMMRLFYLELVAGKSVLMAFQSARETLRKTYSNPLLWAPFVLLES